MNMQWTIPHWTGPEAAIRAAEAQVTDLLAGRTEYRQGQPLDPDQRITRRWAVPVETATPGLWAIPAYDGMAPPAGCASAGPLPVVALGPG